MRWLCPISCNPGARIFPPLFSLHVSLNGQVCSTRFSTIRKCCCCCCCWWVWMNKCVRQPAKTSITVAGISFCGRKRKFSRADKESCSKKKHGTGKIRPRRVRSAKVLSRSAQSEGGNRCWAKKLFAREMFWTLCIVIMPFSWEFGRQIRKVMGFFVMEGSFNM